MVKAESPCATHDLDAPRCPYDVDSTHWPPCIDKSWKQLMIAHWNYCKALPFYDRAICTLYTLSSNMFNKDFRCQSNITYEEISIHFLNHLFNNEAGISYLADKGHAVDKDPNRIFCSLLLAITARFRDIVMQAPKPTGRGRVWRVDLPRSGGIDLSEDIELFDYEGFISTNLVENCVGYFDEDHPFFCTVTYLATRPSAERCCIHRMTIDPGTPCLYIGPLSVGPVLEVVLLHDACNFAVGKARTPTHISGPLVRIGPPPDIRYKHTTGARNEKHIRVDAPGFSPYNQFSNRLQTSWYLYSVGTYAASWGIVEAQVTPKILEAQVTPKILEARVTPKILEAQVTPKILEAQVTHENKQWMNPKIRRSLLQGSALVAFGALLGAHRISTKKNAHDPGKERVLEVKTPSGNEARDVTKKGLN